ncbi:hypothetical protein ACHAW5_004488 [Stephanodiscus triporus]|uniref:Uncharacterized protein n=1 Tax=Stephanodiscus triporus TaxID=2934178 RepID=A0ABD3Q6F3_9STRA
MEKVTEFCPLGLLPPTPLSRSLPRDDADATDVDPSRLWSLELPPPILARLRNGLSNDCLVSLVPSAANLDAEASLPLLYL